jgi:hypothetical protein
MDRKVARFAAGIIGALLLSVFVFGTQTEGQTNRRRSTSKTTPSKTPVPINSDPAVISRADDYPTVVIEPATQNMDPNRIDPTKGETGSTETIEDLRERILSLENKGRKDPDERQRRLSLNLDILTKSEQRADGLRKQLFEMIEKENTIRGRMDQIDNDMRPETIERTMATMGSLRPEELRAQRKRSLELEKANLQSLLTEVQKNRANLELNLGRADSLVDRLRARIEKEIDTALADDESTDTPARKP